jgi:hypothetical protein
MDIHASPSMPLREALGDLEHLDLRLDAGNAAVLTGESCKLCE